VCLTPLIITPEKTSAAESEEQRTAKLVEGAKKEGNLLWYSATEVKDSIELLDGFKKKYPFTNTGLYRGNGEAVLSRIITEARAKKHLWYVTINGGLKGELLKREGYLAKYPSPQRKFFPEGHMDPEGYWTDVYFNAFVIAYNTRLVPSQDVPKTYEDLLDPKWKGKMGSSDNPFDWFAAMFRKEVMGKEKGLEYMKKLSEQDIQFRAGKTLITNLVVAGEMSLGIALYNQGVEQLKEKGAPIEWVAIEPIIPLLHPLCISARAPHPNTARLFVDYVLSKEGQEILARQYRIPTRVDVDPLVPRLKKGLKTLPFDPDIVDDYDKYVKLFRTIFLKK